MASFSFSKRREMKSARAARRWVEPSHSNRRTTARARAGSSPAGPAAGGAMRYTVQSRTATTEAGWRSTPGSPARATTAPGSERTRSANARRADEGR